MFARPQSSPFQRSWHDDVEPTQWLMVIAFVLLLILMWMVCMRLKKLETRLRENRPVEQIDEPNLTTQILRAAPGIVQAFGVGVIDNWDIIRMNIIDEPDRVRGENAAFAANVFKAQPNDKQNAHDTMALKCLKLKYTRLCELNSKSEYNLFARMQENTWGTTAQDKLDLAVGRGPADKRYTQLVDMFYLEIALNADRLYKTTNPERCQKIRETLGVIKKSKTKMSNIYSDTAPDAGINQLHTTILMQLWIRSKTCPNTETYQERIFDALADCKETNGIVCSVGRATRMLGCMQGCDPDEELGRTVLAFDTLRVLAREAVGNMRTKFLETWPEANALYQEEELAESSNIALDFNGKPIGITDILKIKARNILENDYKSHMTMEQYTKVYEENLKEL